MILFILHLVLIIESEDAINVVDTTDFYYLLICLNFKGKVLIHNKLFNLSEQLLNAAYLKSNASIYISIRVWDIDSLIRIV